MKKSIFLRKKEPPDPGVNNDIISSKNGSIKEEKKPKKTSEKETSEKTVAERLDKKLSGLIRCFFRFFFFFYRPVF